jgi:hypothetical protein
MYSLTVYHSGMWHGTGQEKLGGDSVDTVNIPFHLRYSLERLWLSTIKNLSSA